MKQVCKRTQGIQHKLNDIASELQEFRKNRDGEKTVRAIGQWNRNLKAEYLPFSEKRAMLVRRALEDREKQYSMKEEEEMAKRKVESEQFLRGRMLNNKSKSGKRE